MSTSGPGTLIVAPLRVEARALQRGAPSLRVLRSGAGPQRSRRALSRLRTEAADRLVVAGLCGALDSALEPGDVIVTSHLLDCDVPLDHDPALARALAAQGLRVRIAPILCVTQLVQGAERARLRARGAAAVDMESRWLAPAAQGRPLSVIRVVLDGPRHELLRPGTARHLLRGLRVLAGVARAVEDWSTPQANADRVEARSTGGR